VLADGFRRCTQSLQGKAVIGPSLDHGPVPHCRFLPFYTAIRCYSTRHKNNHVALDGRFPKGFTQRNGNWGFIFRFFIHSFKHPIHRHKLLSSSSSSSSSSSLLKNFPNCLGWFWGPPSLLFKVNHGLCPHCYSPPPKAKAVHEWSHTSTPPTCHHEVRRDQFTLQLPS